LPTAPIFPSLPWRSKGASFVFGTCLDFFLTRSPPLRLEFGEGLQSHATPALPPRTWYFSLLLPESSDPQIPAIFLFFITMRAGLLYSRDRTGLLRRKVLLPQIFSLSAPLFSPRADREPCPASIVNLHFLAGCPECGAIRERRSPNLGNFFSFLFFFAPAAAGCN